MSLQTALEDWTDWDGAAFVVARELGLVSPGTPYIDAKRVFWSANRLGDALHRVLRELVTAGALEYRNEPDDQYRWNAAFNVAGPQTAAE